MTVRIFSPLESRGEFSASNGSEQTKAVPLTNAWDFIERKLVKSFRFGRLIRMLYPWLKIALAVSLPFTKILAAP